MTFGELLSQSFDYAKKSVWGEWSRWVILFVTMIIQSITFFIVPLFNGYIFRIWQGADPAPDVDQWKKLFVDGWRVNIVSIIYMIPVIIVAVLAMGPGLMQMISGSIMGDPTVAMAGLMGMGLGLLVVIIVAIIVEIFMLTGVVRFAKMDSIAEAFSFGEIAGHIKKIDRMGPLHRRPDHPVDRDGDHDLHRRTLHDHPDHRLDHLPLPAGADRDIRRPLPGHPVRQRLNGSSIHFFARGRSLPMRKNYLLTT
ncbi:MAG: DUF4013 domain-containing protein [Methanomicrobiales archaeon]